MEQISNVIQNHLMETLDEMQKNISAELNIPESNITFIEYDNRTDVCVTKDGKQISAVVRSKSIKE